MKKVTKLRTCDWGLLFLTIAILVSGVQLEVTHCNGLVFVLIHIVVGLLFMFMATYHIYLYICISDIVIGSLSSVGRGVKSLAFFGGFR